MILTLLPPYIYLVFWLLHFLTVYHYRKYTWLCLIKMNWNGTEFFINEDWSQLNVINRSSGGIDFTLDEMTIFWSKTVVRKDGDKGCWSTNYAYMVDSRVVELL